MSCMFDFQCHLCKFSTVGPVGCGPDGPGGCLALAVALGHGVRQRGIERLCQARPMAMGTALAAQADGFRLATQKLLIATTNIL